MPIMLNILTPRGYLKINHRTVAFENMPVDMIIFRTIDGDMGVLSDHEPHSALLGYDHIYDAMSRGRDKADEVLTTGKTEAEAESASAGRKKAEKNLPCRKVFAFPPNSAAYYCHTFFEALAFLAASERLRSSLFAA